MTKTVVVRIVLGENGMPTKVTVQKPGSKVFREVSVDYLEEGGGQVGWLLHEGEFGDFDLKMYYDLNTNIPDEEDE